MLNERREESRQSHDGQNVDAASRRFQSVCDREIGYFDATVPISNLDGNLPHFRQEGVTYFVTFRLNDSLPREKLDLWLKEREKWLKLHPEPHSPQTKREYANQFPERIQRWLDAGYGECWLSESHARQIVVDALNHFEGVRHLLRTWVVMPNHVHAIVTPLGDNELSKVLHSWKSYSAKIINKMLGRTGAFWQKESFDHIVRSPESLQRIERYIQENPAGLPAGTYAVHPERKTRRDAASTET